MKIIGFVRVWTEDQAKEGISLEAQQAITQYARELRALGYSFESIAAGLNSQRISAKRRPSGLLQ